MARAFRSVRADPLSFLGQVSERYGDLVAFPVPGAPVLLVNDPADVRQVLQTSARRWGKQTVQYAALARVTGPGLLASSEPNWIEHRRLAAPAFHHQRLEAVGEQVHAAADRAVTAGLGGDYLADRCGGGRRCAHTPHRPGRRRASTVLRGPVRAGAASCWTRRAWQRSWWSGWGGRSCRRRRGPRLRLNLRLRADRRRLDSISSELVAPATCSAAASRAAARTVTTSSACSWTAT